MSLVEPGDNLRQVLRAATAQAHDRLDSTMRSVAGWERVEDYAHFLSLQHAARQPVEAWLALNAPDDLHPPPQTPLIAQDLKQLGVARSAQGTVVEPPLLGNRSASATRAVALGIAWVLAGSSLGNRAILAEIRRKAAASAWPHWPELFLGDAAMLAFWKSLRTQIEDQSEMEEVEVATHAASTVFDHFLAHAQAARPVPRPPENIGIATNRSGSLRGR